MKHKKILIALAVILLNFLIDFIYLKLIKKNLDILTLYGNIEIRQVDLGFRVEGRVKKLLKEEGYIADYSVKDEGKFKVLEIVLKYDAKNKPIITKLERISKPGLRNYSKAKNLPKVLGGMGIAVVSTSKGLLTDRKARKENLGGEVLCYVY